ncbi:terpene synthase family protein [Embleya sp. MST-111070]|uniref:terpene synthase family protein n=1 Tax=Embleya sp. MST-111070 TaxID=3398231 RepID=UPI003F737C2D
MPQDFDIDLPFPPHVGPDRDAARTRSLLWAQRHGLITNANDEHRFLEWDIAGLMAHWLPAAQGAALDLAVDAVVVATILDDQFDGDRANQPERIAAGCADFLRLIRHGTTPTSPRPLVAAFADVWTRLCAQASTPWRERTSTHWQWYLNAYPAEGRNRARRHVPTIDEHFALRRRSGFVHAMLDLSEKAYGFESSPRVRDIPEVGRMIDITADVVDTLNDVHSLEKEESRGDVHNLVLVIENQMRLPRDRSLHRVREMIRAWCGEFLALEHRLPALAQAHHLSADESEQARRLCVCMRSAMSGYLEWSRCCRRYSHPVPPDRPAYPTDLL